MPFSELARRIQQLLQRRQFEADLAEEMHLHRELRAADYQASGVADSEAAAHRRFGNEMLLRERSRDAWGWAFLDNLIQDLRYAFRNLRANRSFTIIALLSLALGIGANTAMFTILNAVMLRSLPVEDPRRLVSVKLEGNDILTNPLWEAIRDANPPFKSMLAYGNDRFDLSTGGETRFADALWVSGSFFHTLGVPALHGRMIDPSDDRRGGGASGPVAVISYGFWQTHFAGDPAAIGKSITLNRRAFTIVGVTPPWFRGLNVEIPFEVALPIGCEPIFHTDRSALNERSWWWLRVLGRLPDGQTIEQTQGRMKALAPAILQATLPHHWEKQDQQKYMKYAFTFAPAGTGFSEVAREYRKALFTIMAVVVIVLLIACGNIANLLLARAAARSREISVRLALGARRARVVRQLLTESLLLALLGSLGGTLLAYWGSRFLVNMLSTANDTLDIDLSPDLNVLAFTILIACATGLLFGLVPAFRATRVTPNTVLKESARGTIEGGSRFGLGRILVTGQVALSLALLIAATLFLGSFRNLLHVNTGFESRGVLIARVAVPEERIATERRVPLFTSLIDRVRLLPGVQSVSASDVTPVGRMMWNEYTEPEGYQAKSREDTLTWFNRVFPEYFATLHTPIVAGREFEQRDTQSAPRVIIINQTAAAKFFPGKNPVGRTIKLARDLQPLVKDSYQIIGVVGDTKYRELKEKPQPIAYLSGFQDAKPRSSTNILIRAASPAALIPSVRTVLSSANPDAAIEFRNFERQIDDSLIQPRMIAVLSAFFGSLALLLAMIGLYGVTAYSVVRRQGEIGIRIALGAAPASVIRLVLRDVVLTLVVGALAGVLLAISVGRFIASLLFDVKPADPTLILIATAILGAATALAGFIPANRAAKLDPMSTLRDAG